MLPFVHVIAGISWEPEIRGALVVMIGSAVLMGSMPAARLLPGYRDFWQTMALRSSKSARNRQIRSIIFLQRKVLDQHCHCRIWPGTIVV